MSEKARGWMWLVYLAVFGGFGIYVWYNGTRPKPAPPPSKPLWSLSKYDSGKYYFAKDVLTEFRTVCESSDCERILGNVEVGRLSGSGLDDVKQDGLHLVVTQKGTIYRFRIEAMGDDLSPQVSSGGDSDKP
jgi:hypothetical protein